MAAAYEPSRGCSVRDPYVIRDGVGGAILATVNVIQQIARNDFSDAGSVFDTLASVTVSGTELVVELSDSVSGLVIADAVRIELQN